MLIYCKRPILSAIFETSVDQKKIKERNEN